MFPVSCSVLFRCGILTCVSSSPVLGTPPPYFLSFPPTISSLRAAVTLINYIYPHSQFSYYFPQYLITWDCSGVWIPMSCIGACRLLVTLFFSSRIRGNTWQKQSVTFLSNPFSWLRIPRLTNSTSVPSELLLFSIIHLWPSAPMKTQHPSPSTQKVPSLVSTKFMSFAFVSWLFSSQLQ